MTDEFGGVIVEEFAGLKLKMKKVQQKVWVVQLSLINFKMLCLVKKLLDTKWKEFKAT